MAASVVVAGAGTGVDVVDCDFILGVLSRCDVPGAEGFGGDVDTGDFAIVLADNEDEVEDVDVDAGPTCLSLRTSSFLPLTPAVKPTLSVRILPLSMFEDEMARGVRSAANSCAIVGI